MEVNRLVVRGKDISLLASLLKGKLAACHEERFDNTVVLASEDFYLRVSSDVFSVIILRNSSSDVCECSILTGGGGQGFARIALGAERSRNKRLVRTIKELCASYSWKIEE